ncbi:CHAD domain-containing protein [Pseudonocardia eucalypti]|uniref:CHAD domain-containing protein n=1 Tax=Pseudonocardia eucalypti TaxID=648755 RepID=A0ABP9PLN4_9PSEU|nr:CHAD domain-containing protein [Pseudonocardia eucalypti]
MVLTGATAVRHPAPIHRGTEAPPLAVLRLPEPLTAVPSDPPVHHVRVALDTRLRALLKHDAGARIGRDVEDVHQMRVSVRRMRAALKAARPLLDAEWSDTLRAELGWLGRSLGPVRDLDVLLPRLRGLAADLPENERAAAEALISTLDADYTLARADMMHALAAPRYVTLLERLADAVRLPLPTPSATERQPELVELVRKEFRMLRKAVRRAGEDPPDEVLHALRIKGKRLRYTGELVEPVLGKPVRQLLGATSGLQEVLGDHQDACVAQEKIRELLDRGATSGDPRLLTFVAGRLVEREYARAEQQRGLWWAAWQRVAARASVL